MLVVYTLNQCENLVFACLGTLVFTCIEPVVAAFCSFLTFLLFSVEDNYVTPTLEYCATHDSNLGVVYWGYCGLPAWGQDLMRHVVDK